MIRFPICTSVSLVLLCILGLAVLGACNDGGPTDPSRGIALSASSGMQITPVSLDFGDLDVERLLLIVNNTPATFDWTAQPSKGWLSLPTSGRLEPGGFKVLTVTAVRSRLSVPGLYKPSIRFESSAGSQSVPVTLEVPPPPPPSEGSGLDAIDATGTWDVTTQLNEYFESVPDGSVVSLPPGAKYRVEGVLRLMEKRNLTIEGNGALIFAETDGHAVTPPGDLKHLWPRARSHVEVNGGSNIVIKNLLVRGANPNAGAAEGAYVVSLEGQHGFDVRGVDGLLLDNVSATDTYGDLVYISGKAGEWSRNVRVTNSHFERSWRQGIAITGGKGVQVLDSYIGDIARTVIDLEPASAGAGAINILFQRNTFGPCRHLLLNSGGGGPNVSAISFVANHLVAIGLKIRVAAADGSRRSNYRILDNVSDVPLGLPEAAMRFMRVDGIEVRGNYQAMVPRREMAAVWSCASTEALVRGNEFPGAAKTYEGKSTCG